MGIQVARSIFHDDKKRKKGTRMYNISHLVARDKRYYLGPVSLSSSQKIKPLILINISLN